MPPDPYANYLIMNFPIVRVVWDCTGFCLFISLFLFFLVQKELKRSEL